MAQQSSEDRKKKSYGNYAHIVVIGRLTKDVEVSNPFENQPEKRVTRTSIAYNDYRFDEPSYYDIEIFDTAQEPHRFATLLQNWGTKGRYVQVAGTPIMSKGKNGGTYPKIIPADINFLDNPEKEQNAQNNQAGSAPTTPPKGNTAPPAARPASAPPVGAPGARPPGPGVTPPPMGAPKPPAPGIPPMPPR